MASQKRGSTPSQTTHARPTTQLGSPFPSSQGVVIHGRRRHDHSSGEVVVADDMNRWVWLIAGPVGSDGAGVRYRDLRRGSKTLTPTVRSPQAPATART